MDYKGTLNLPRTSFPMKAALPEREPATLARWESQGLYERTLELRAEAAKRDPERRFLLHDGPPYANGDIHIGHALNKVLKDVVRKYKHLCGYYAPYRPGWDCHGLPIELEVEKKVGRKKKSEMTAVEVRKLCADYARRFVDKQGEDFRRLGVLGDWKAPYLTMAPEYEARETRELATILAGGALYRGLRPVYWCASCVTALAEAEVDYDDHVSTSVYVRFPFPAATEAFPQAADSERAAVAIWTTTPWTLPANLAVCLNPTFEYALVEHENGPLVVASDMVDRLRDRLKLGRVLERVPAKRLEGLESRHPWLDRPSPLLLGEHVTLEAGTGCVHTAPGHGHDDFAVGGAYGLDAYAPVDDHGPFTDDVPECAGQRVFDSDPAIVELLESRGALLASERYEHSYPHCWRCKKPIVFRATEQWFVSMEHEDLRERVLAEIDRVRWIPKWGRERIRGMIESRPDWCLSRQRVWGVPIVALKCRGCSTVLADPELVRNAADLFAARGSDAWFTADLKEMLPQGLACKGCGGGEFEPLRDILDVWFDSGVSYGAVLEEEFGEDTVADLYLEGSDQHRGWFHTSLLTSVATRGRAPYKAVLTHGFVLDGKGRKMSKSAGNVVAPQEIIKRYGADILRLWVAAEDYRDDVKISEEILQRLADSYRRVRNTARNMLGNLAGFDPDRDRVAYADMMELDRWVLARLYDFVARCRQGYESYELHVVYHTLNNFCSVDLSALYFDIVKDRLYCSAAASAERHSAQTAMYEVLRALTVVVAPVLSFTAEEIWQAMHPGDERSSVFLADFPQPDSAWRDPELSARWDRLWEVRADVTRALESKRKVGEIGHPLEARVRLRAASRADRELLEAVGAENLAYLFIVSQVELDGEGGGGLEVAVEQAKGHKCARCWNYSEAVGSYADHPEICDRCFRVVTA